MLVGILAFQGDYFLHMQALDKLNVKHILVRDSKSLYKTDGLIIPGGESTVISKMIYRNNMNNDLIKYAKSNSIYGTCAGAIVMSSKINDHIVKPLKIINVQVMRNFWGRQIHSFSENIKLSFTKKYFNATFIRAPKFKILSNDLTILSNMENEPILIRNKKHLISSFHPEIGNDLSIHEYFVKMIDK